ncbi:MAG: hypothetical protein KJ600_06050 [Nanoarchaeota archaeon]|nr:hypothetical protein [Nanoarchaeota archaeon]MBU1104089.1 hypothetical protein [Nanoarchaeota archaeon]
MTVIQSGLSLNFYIFTAALIVGLLFVVYSIRKLKYSWKQIWKSVWISFLIALVLALVFSLLLGILARPVYNKVIDCANPPCPMVEGYDSMKIFGFVFVMSLPALLFIVWVVYYVVALVRSRKGLGGFSR